MYFVSLLIVTLAPRRSLFVDAIRSGRNRRVGNGGREQGEASPREPPDKVGIKPTSPRQVHPVDQISPVPYARRSLERRSRTVPSSKNSPGMNATGYDRRTDSFCPAPNRGSPDAPPAYPTAPNICVTGGKIEFITPPGSTISSNASGNCSTLLSSPSLTPSPSPKRESPQRLRSTLPVKKTQNVSPSKRNATRAGRNPRRLASPATSNLSESPKSPFILPPAGPPSVPLPPIPREDPKISSSVKIDEIRSQNGGSLELRRQDLDGGKVRRSSTMPVKSDSENELQTLREENVQVKKQLASLQQEFLKLQEYVKDLQKEKAAPPSSTEEDRTTDKMLVERCSALEQVNAQLQADSHLQRQQYEKCLDKVASQVVQAILVQKTQQEQCERLSKKVEDLQKQNLTLSSFIVSKGKFQSLSHCRKSQLLPVSLALSTVNSQSLPNTLVKAKAHCDTNKVSATENSECWYNTKEASTSSLKPSQTSRTHPVFSNSVLPSSGSSSLPQSRSSRKRSLHHQTSADVCWYDIIKSLQKGETVPHSTSHNLGNNHNLSSDSSSVDTEERSIAGQRRTLTRIEDTISTSSSGDDFHAVSFPTSRSQHQQGETSTCFPSNTASNSESPLRNGDCNLVPASSQCSHPVKGRSSDITLDFISQSTHQNVVVNFSLTSNTIQSTNDKDAIPPTISKPVNSSDSSPSTNPDSKASSGSTSKSQDNESEAKSTEVIVKDEGYSTMSSDVQSEAKENVVVGTISTVEEEKGKSFEGENEGKESSPTGTLKNNSPSLETLKVEKSNNKKNLNLGVVSMSIKETETSQPEYCDGLRVVYDEEDTNSDIFFVPISDEGDKYLRHSFNFPFPEEPLQLHRCFSDSYLYKLFVRFPNCSQSKSKKLSINQNTLQSLPLKKRNQARTYNTYLRRAFRKESLKKGCLKLCNRASEQSANKNEGRKFSNSLNYDFLSQVFPPSISHPRILSPSYSHAEMEDWSLDLSGEDLTTPGGTEPSVAESSAPSHHLSQPSIQEATLELEEDHNDFLWNGTTYFKADDNDLSWPYDNDKSKAWDLNLVGNKQCRSMISPKSGCSDQPAMWSSSEQLSCCSDIASKCSTDIENFCEQLCNLPELKRLSLCSSENGGNESHPSNSKLNEIDCNEDNSEIIEDINVETVFTRDFYRLVKFESTKSLTASSKSLATSEGFLTLDRLKGLESLQNNKTLASVLGFIAEQQKYCNDREVMDENASFGPMSSKVEEDKDQNSEVSFQMQISEDSQSNNEMENIPEGRSHRDDNVLTSSESLSCLDLDSEMRNSFSCSSHTVDAPPKPKRSTSLNLGVRGGRSYRSRGTLPPLPSSYSPPPIPSRSTSRSTLPHQNAAFRPFRVRPRSPEIPEEPFPPPPPLADDSYVEPYHAIPMEPPVPKVPLHRTPIPNLPLRSSSISRDSRFATTNAACASPPVPKRITSRALPTPPLISIPPRTSSLENSNSTPRQSTRHNRPRSLLKEATVSNAINKNQGRQRGSCGDLGPLCRNSATLMLELQKMAKAEEEEKEPSGFYIPEATSPGTEVGLGTGWVRVEPVSDLGDPQTRANLLDTMLQSSEGCSSETDEDLAKQLQHTELLKVVQRNRRKRKASRHSGSDPMRVVGWCHQSPRPTILGRHSLFTRYGEEEESALKEFQFLESFPSQSDMLGADPPPSTITSSYIYSYDEDEPCPFYTPIPYSSNIYARPTTNLKDLRSSEPCQDTHNYPLSSVPPAVDSNVVPCSSSSNYMNDRRASHCSSHYSDRGNPFIVFNENSLFGGARQMCDSDYPSFQKHSKVIPPETADNKPLYQNVPSPRPSNRCSNDLDKKEMLSVCRQSELKQTSPNSSELKGSYDHEKMLLRSSRSKIPMKCEEEMPDSRKCPDQIPCQREKNDERALIDTRSLSNVKATIQKLNCRNQSSGKFQCNSGNNRISNSDTQNVSTHYSKPFSFLSTKPRPPLALNQASERCSEFSSSHTSGSTPVTTGSPNSKRTPKLPGSNLVKRLTANSSASREPPVNASTAASLPPKGSSSPRPKEKQGVVASKLPPKYGAFGKGMRSPRLPRFKLGRNRPDPLDAFNGKSLCDSGSSECSDKGFGRLSISDSCAEIFSPGESGDEVFSKHQ